VQFDHRLLATLTVVAVLSTLFVGLATRPPRAVHRALLAFLGIALMQYLLGVATLVFVVPTALATVHQAVAALLLAAAIVLLHSTRPAPVRQRA
jgi:cytochrome c oxidase assembly protein subunit 15